MRTGDVISRCKEVVMAVLYLRAKQRIYVGRFKGFETFKLPEA